MTPTGSLGPHLLVLFWQVVKLWGHEVWLAGRGYWRGTWRWLPLPVPTYGLCFHTGWDVNKSRHKLSLNCPDGLTNVPLNQEPRLMSPSSASRGPIFPKNGAKGKQALLWPPLLTTYSIPPGHRHHQHYFQNFFGHQFLQITLISHLDH